MADYTYAYLILAGVYFVFGVVCFIRFKKYRIPMLVTSIVMAAGGPFSEFFYIPEYWNPIFIGGFTVETPLRTWRFGLEDIIGAIGFVALSTALFELFCKKPLNFNNNWQWIPTIKISLLGLLSLILDIIYFYVFDLSGLRACTLSIIMVAILLLLIRPEYIRAALLAAFLSAGLYWLVLHFLINPMFPGVFDQIWNPKGLTGIRVTDVPVEEIIWAFFGTLLAGPLYRMTHESKSRTVEVTIPLVQIKRES